MKVRFGGLDQHYRRHATEIDAAVARVLASGYYVGGPEVEALEAAFSAFAKTPHTVGVANGTDAIALGLIAAGVAPGDEVIVPALSAYPTTVAVVQAGGIPVFVDVQQQNGLLDPALVRSAITPRTRAIVPVHLYGMCCDLDAIDVLRAAHGLVMVEDCAQAHGASYRGRPAGTVGIAAGWSFYPTKNLGAVGDAGATTTRSAELAARLKRLRNYGQANRYEHVERGFNSRLDPLQAAILGVKLRHLDAENTRRRELADRYDAGLSDLTAIVPLTVPADSVSSRHLYPVRLQDASRREAFQTKLAAEGIETLIHYPIAMPDQPATPAAWRRDGAYPNARGLAASLVSLPLHPELEPAQVDHVIATVRRWVQDGR